MNLKDYSEMALEFMENGQENLVSASDALRDEVSGLKMYEAPIFGAASAGDSLFKRLKEEGIVGSHHRLPEEWLQEAQTVISFFAPFTLPVRKSNSRNMIWPSDEWLHARIEGQKFLNLLLQYLKAETEKFGYLCVIPSQSQLFKSDDQKKHTSNWSERHVAHICGLGTFSLSKGLITEKGVAGRFGSLVTNLKIKPEKERPYSQYDEYCTYCGACIDNCPAKAINLREGKKHEPCCDYINFIRKKEAPRYGCGKCQVSVPCEDQIPADVRNR
ncbi:MAG: epoxyqueuosine reductase [Tindallia sp. MSAO_Bac2]|nr:MAG: epoxyqueuosine reductase [Tindallia sp. MSAO_Bac2]